MWQSIVDIIVTAVVACFDVFGTIMDAFPGAWTTVFTIFTILAVGRFLLGPVLGASFSGSSDQAKIKEMKKQNRLREAAKK